MPVQGLKSETRVKHDRGRSCSLAMNMDFPPFHLDELARRRGAIIAADNAVKNPSDTEECHTDDDNDRKNLNKEFPAGFKHYDDYSPTRISYANS